MFRKELKCKCGQEHKIEISEKEWDINLYKERVRSNSKEDENGCWIWEGSYKHGRPGTLSMTMLPHKYGLSKGLLNLNAYQVSCLLFNENVDDFENIRAKKLEVSHLCHNPKCVNPKHLKYETHEENIKRSKEIRILNKVNKENQELIEIGINNLQHRIALIGRKFNKLSIEEINNML